MIFKGTKGYIHKKPSRILRVTKQTDRGTDHKPKNDNAHTDQLTRSKVRLHYM